jgi:hypothetical protein
MDEQKVEYGKDLSSTTRSALWEHYYMKDDEIKAVPKRRLRRVTKKEIIVRTLKDQKDHEGILSLHDLSGITGMTPHDLSGHLTHLVNEGKVVRRGRGLFALSAPVEGKDHRTELKDLVKSVANRSRASIAFQKPMKPIEQKVVISDKGDSESRRMMFEFLSDALKSCADVELVIKCGKDPQGKGNRTTIELKAH